MMKIWGMTDIGLVRKENQDAYAVRVSEDTGYTMCVVCDGMGGLVEGDWPVQLRWRRSLMPARETCGPGWMLRRSVRWRILPWLRLTAPSISGLKQIQV